MANPMTNEEQIALKELELGLQVKLADFPFLSSKVRISTYRDILNLMVVQLRTYILAEEIDHQEKDVTFDYDFPANWWEHFKQDVVPRWLYRLLRLKPVRKHTHVWKRKVVFSRKATFPKANILFPDKVGTVVRYMQDIEETDASHIVKEV